MIVPATISSEILIRVEDLPQDQIDLLKAAVTFKNEEREKADRLQIFGRWDIPETIALWREERRRGGDHVLCLPRGFAAQLIGGLASSGHEVQWDDRRSSVRSSPGYFKPFLLRDYQWPFVADLIRAEQGIGHAPTASGKSVAALAMMAIVQQRSIVIVDKAALLDQWRERAAQFLGLSMNLEDDDSVGMIGQDVWVERDLTICLRQTLSSRKWQTDALEWGSTWGLCIADEVHHLGSAETLIDVVRALPCRYMIGLSATPARTETQGMIIGSLIGPLVAMIDNQSLVDEGIVIEPVVRVVETGFEMDFWPTHDSHSDGECEKPGCKKTNQHSHKDNWEACLKALISDDHRNAMIAEEIVSDRGHVHLVFARRKAHLEAIRTALDEAGWDGPVYDLTGKQNADGESQEISRAIASGGFWELDAERKKKTKKVVFRRVRDSPTGAREAVVLSTVADEGLDIPPIDRIHVVYPLRQRVPTIQLVGRGTRSADGKHDCVVVDYKDSGCSVLADQHAERMRTYRSQGLALESHGDVLVGEKAQVLSLPARGSNRPALPRVYSMRSGADPVPADAIYVGRPTAWGNPFVVGEYGRQGECVELYRAWINEPAQRDLRERARVKLSGRDLVCWCSSPSAPAPCHADILLSVANVPVEMPDDDLIEWWTFEDRNEVWYRHRGCNGRLTIWMAPHDGVSPSIAHSTKECPNCCLVRPLRARREETKRLVLVCGSRGWTDRSMIAGYVAGLADQAYDDNRWLVVVHGGAPGADVIAGEVASSIGVEVDVHEADWSQGHGAGFARNLEMLDLEPERVGAFSLGTPGTQHTIDQARARGIEVDLHGPRGLINEALATHAGDGRSTA